jgi:hypothetical protein
MEARFRIERELGHGGMATACVGDLKHERDVSAQAFAS